MATFWERAAHSVNRTFSLLCLFCSFGCFPFCFQGRYLDSDCVSYSSLLTFYALFSSFKHPRLSHLCLSSPRLLFFVVLDHDLIVIYMLTVLVRIGESSPTECLESLDSGAGWGCRKNYYWPFRAVFLLRFSVIVVVGVCFRPVHHENNYV